MKRKWFFVSLSLIAIVSTSQRAGAATYTFTIDPLQSSLTISGTADFGVYGTYPIAPQGPGSTTAPISGSVVAITDLATTISFPGGSSLVPGITGNWAPGVGGAAGTQPAEFGVLVSGGFLGGIDYAGTNVNLDLTSGPIALLGPAFDATNLTGTLLSGTVDIRGYGPLLNGAFDSQSFSNLSDQNQSGLGSLTVLGNLATLTIPVYVQEDLPFTFSTAHATLTGQIVATAVVPEPSTMAMAALGAIGMVVLGGFRRAKLYVEDKSTSRVIRH